jgi:hypothetical protein
MAGTELVTVASNALSATRSVITILSEQRSLSKIRSAEYKIIIESAIAAARSHAAGRLFAVNMDELLRAWILMESYSFSGPAYEMAFRQYCILGRKLERYLDEFQA